MYTIKLIGKNVVGENMVLEFNSTIAKSVRRLVPLSFLILMVFTTLTYSKILIPTLEITASPIDTASEYDGAFIEFDNGAPLPIDENEGVYKLKFSLQNLNSIKNPALYLGASPYPVKVYLDDEYIFNWGHTLSSFKMQTNHVFSIPLYSGNNNSGLVTILFYTDGQKIAFPKFWVDSKENVDNYVHIQNLFCSDGIKSIALLSYILGIIFIFYFFISNRKYPIILFIGLFGIFEALGYTGFAFDGPGMSQMLWLKVSRIGFAFSMPFLLSATILLLGGTHKIMSAVEKAFYSLAVIGTISILLSPTFYSLTQVFNFVAILILYPIFAIIVVLLFKSAIIKREKISLYMLIGFMAVVITSSIDLFYLLSYSIPYAWFSAYGQFFLLVIIIASVGVIEHKVHSDLIETTEEIIAINKELKAANSAVQNESVLRDNFIKAFSHEVRTPLSAVVGITQELSDKSMPFYSQLATSTNRLRLAINNIFDYQKLDDTVEVTLSSINPLEICREIVSYQKEKADSKGILLEIIEDSNNRIPSNVIGGNDALESIVNNVVSNAVKFSESGTVSVFLSYVNSSFNISVKDCGCGISEETLAHIFTEFNPSTSNSRYTTNENKIGIGLRITKKQVDSLNGTISIKNRDDVGVQVDISLPFNQVVEIKQTLPKSTSNKVLIVDDNDINRLLLSKILERDGFDSAIMKNGKEAVEELRKNSENYFAVLMDIQMPIMNGLEATTIIRDEGIKTPIIALTANADKEECIAAGMDLYISKPFTSKVVIDALKTFV